MELITDPL